MNNNTSNNSPEIGQVSVTLIQHWAQMVNEARGTVSRQAAEIAQLHERIHNTLQDVRVLHRMLDEQIDEAVLDRRLTLDLSRLLQTMINENPEFVVYRDDYNEIINGYNRNNPIDLTADEELE